MSILNIRYLIIVTAGAFLVFYALYWVVILLFSVAPVGACLIVGFFDLFDDVPCWDATLVFLALWIATFAGVDRIVSVLLPKMGVKIPFRSSGLKWYTLLAIIFSVGGMLLLFRGLIDYTESVYLARNVPLISESLGTSLFIVTVGVLAFIPVSQLEEAGESEDTHT